MKAVSEIPVTTEETTSEIAEVTPQLARAWLSENVNSKNRGLQKWLVQKYAKDMTNGTWHENGDAIRFGADGILYDGQHRLAAIILTGTPQRFVIVRGLQPKARLSMDSGARRDIADTITIVHGGTGWKRKVAMIRLIVPALIENNNRALRVAEVLDWHERLKDGIDWAATLPGSRTAGLARAPISGALALAYGRDPSAVAEFAVKAQTGEGHAANSPMLVFREMIVLNQNLSSNSYISRREIALKTLRAVHAHLKNETIVQLKISEAALNFFRKPYEK